jgi:type IV secretory pathway VirB6-like protein
MATWKAKIQAVGNGQYFDVTVNASSVGTAKRTIENIYNPTVITNLRQVSSKDSYIEETGDMSFKYLFVGTILGLYLLVTYWYVVVPIIAVAVILNILLKK